MKSIAYYITAHGYGHGTRSCDIINALHSAAPGTEILVKSDLPPTFLQQRLPPETTLIPGAFDVGLIQKDSILVDLEASLKAIRKVYSQEDQLIQQEVDFIRRQNIGVVVADIPAIPLAAAKQAGVPAIATGNFGWDWIYSDFVKFDPEWQPIVDRFRSVYEQTDLLLRQPFAEPMAAFPEIVDLPLLAKPGNNLRSKLAETSGADPKSKWVLLSFTSLNLSHQALEKLSRLDGYELFSVEPLDWPHSCVKCIRRSVASFSDILASMDEVVTKPGFGIISDCIANDKPIIYADREHFLEYAVLVESINTYCRSAFIPATELYAGKLERALKTIESAPSPPKQMPRGGAELAAREILKKLN